MKLFFAPASPFVRKCLVAATELGLRERIELVPAAPHPVNRDHSIVAHNPLGKIPTLITDEGTALFDSRVICEYLNALGDGHLLPPAGPERWSVLNDQALADGIADAAVLARYEVVIRPESMRWKDWVAGQLEKVSSGLVELEQRSHGFAGRVDLGTIAVACALGYLDLRFAPLAWRARFPMLAVAMAQFEQRPAMVATRPPAG